MDAELAVRGSIIDSWVDRVSARRGDPRVVLQVAVSGHPFELLVVEAPVALLPDEGWIEDLGSNHCHGSPVAACGRLTNSGSLAASWLRLER